MKVRIRIIAGVLCSFALLSACGRQSEPEKGEPFIYCLNEERTCLVKVACDFSGKDTMEEAEAVLVELKGPTDSIEYVSPIPEHVEVVDCALRGSILEVDFNGAYAEMDNLSEKLARAAVVRSLVQVSGINAVSFTIEGVPLMDSGGHPVGLMNEDDFVENTGSSLGAYQTDTLTLYFADKSGNHLVPQKTEIRHSSNVSKEKLIVESLMKGPSESESYPVINPDANLLSVTIEDGICYVNFDSTFLTGAYNVLPEVTVYSIVNSLVEGTEARKVQITINGETDAKYMGVVDLSQPLEENEGLVAAEE